MRSVATIGCWGQNCIIKDPSNPCNVQCPWLQLCLLLHVKASVLQTIGCLAVSLGGGSGGWLGLATWCFAWLATWWCKQTSSEFHTIISSQETKKA